MVRVATFLHVSGEQEDAVANFIESATYILQHSLQQSAGNLVLTRRLVVGWR